MPLQLAVFGLWYVRLLLAMVDFKVMPSTEIRQPGRHRDILYGPKYVLPKDAVGPRVYSPKQLIIFDKDQLAGQHRAGRRI